MAWWTSRRDILLPEQLVVTGERHYSEGIREVLTDTASGHLQYRCTATLQPEPDNELDPNAVAVMVAGRRVGYIARRHSPAVAATLGGRSAEVKCVINWNGEVTNGIYRVKLFASL